MYYLSRSRSVRLASGTTERTPGLLSLLFLVATAREINRLRENGRVIRYDDHRGDHTTTLTTTLLGVKDGAIAPSSPSISSPTLAASSNGMALPRLSPPLGEHGECLRDTNGRGREYFVHTAAGS